MLPVWAIGFWLAIWVWVILANHESFKPAKRLFFGFHPILGRACDVFYF